jgi:hypothetical protein
MGGREVQFHSFLSLALEAGEWPVNVLATSPTRKWLQHPLNMRLDGLHSQPGHFGEQKNLLPCQEKNDSLGVQPTDESMS